MSKSEIYRKRVQKGERPSQDIIIPENTKKLVALYESDDMKTAVEIIAFILVLSITFLLLPLHLIVRFVKNEN